MLPDTIASIQSPGMYPLTLFIGGDGQSWLEDFTVYTGTPGTVVDLTGVQAYAEIRDMQDNALLVLTATVTDAANGIVRVSATRDQIDAIPWPEDGPRDGSQTCRGRWHLALSDGTTRAVILRGDVRVLR